MTCLDNLQGSAYPIQLVWDGLGGNLLVRFVGIGKDNQDINQVQTEVHRRGEALSIPNKWGQNTVFLI